MKVLEAIKDLSYDDAYTWLYRHGYGPVLADEEIEKWKVATAYKETVVIVDHGKKEVKKPKREKEVRKVIEPKETVIKKRPGIFRKGL